jgi:hypothetical protein
MYPAFTEYPTLKSIVTQITACQADREAYSRLIRALDSYPFDSPVPRDKPKTLYDWLQKHNLPAPLHNPIAEEIARGNLPSLKWLVENGYPLDNSAIDVACEHGHMHILQYLVSKELTIELSHVYIVARYGRVGILRWLLADLFTASGAICEIAAEHGHLEILIAAHENDAAVTARVVTIAASNGHLHILRWCKDNNIPTYPDLASQTILAEQFEVLRWLKEQNYGQFDHSLTIAACTVGRVDILTWLITECDIGVGTICMSVAAKRGDITIMLLLIGMSCTLSSEVFDILIKNNQLKALEWTHKRGARLSLSAYKSTLVHAKETNNEELRKWLEKHPITI